MVCIASILWEDMPYDRYRQNQTQKIISDMMQTLRENNIADIINKSRNQISINTVKIDCDYYDALKEKNQTPSIKANTW